MSFFSVNTNTLYYEIGLNFKFKHKILKDKVISIMDSINEFIPIQRAYTSRSEIELNYYPSLSGHYDVLYNNNNIGILAFNNNSAESRNIYSNPNIISEIQVGNSLIKLINDKKYKTNSLPLMEMVYYFCLNITYYRNIYFKIF